MLGQYCSRFWPFFVASVLLGWILVMEDTFLHSIKFRKGEKNLFDFHVVLVHGQILKDSLFWVEGWSQKPEFRELDSRKVPKGISIDVTQAASAYNNQSSAPSLSKKNEQNQCLKWSTTKFRPAPYRCHESEKVQNPQNSTVVNCPFDIKKKKLDETEVESHVH